jgi:hypothetical protein
VYIIIDKHLKISNSSSFLVYKDSALSSLNVYSNRIDEANAEATVGQNGQKIAQMVFNNTALLFEIDNASVVGPFSSGDYATRLSVGTTPFFDGANSEYTNSPNPAITVTDPTAGHFWIWSGSGATSLIVKLKNNTGTAAAMGFAQVKEFEMSNSAQLSGFLGIGNADEVEFDNSAIFRADPKLNPIPPAPIKGSLYMKYKRIIN